MMRFASFAAVAVAAVAQLDTNGSMYVDALKLTSIPIGFVDQHGHVHTYHWTKTGKSLCERFSDWLSTKMEATFRVEEDVKDFESELTVNDFVKGGRFEFFGLKSEDDLKHGYRPLYAEITDEPDIDGFVSTVSRIFELKGRFVQRHKKWYSAVDDETPLLLDTNTLNTMYLGVWTYDMRNMVRERTRIVAGKVKSEKQKLLKL